MTSRDELLGTMREFDSLMRRSSGLNADVPGHRTEAIAIRRQMAAIFGQLSSASAECFPDPATAAEFRNEFARMRAALSFHQASWPIVAVDYADEDYVASEANVRAICQDFVSWTTVKLR